MTASAQESISRHYNIFNPSIDSLSRATFHVSAPAARVVSVVGDFDSAPLTLKRDSTGLWSGTTGPLPSELYTYRLVIDSTEFADPANPYQVRDIAGISNMMIVGGGKGDNFMARDVPHGTVSKVWYNSPSMGRERRMTIYTPPGYEASTDSFPVLYLLHGMGGDEDAWNELGRAAHILDNMIADGKAEPMIVVMPNGNGRQWAAPGFTSQGLYQPALELSVADNDQFEKSFNEIVSFVDDRYRTKTDRRHRAIAGLSMGGGHAWKISAMNPDMFDAVALFSAKVGWKGDPNADTNTEEMDIFMKPLLDNPPSYYIMSIGRDDFLLENNREFDDFLNSHDMKHDFVLSEGGHCWRNWRDYLTALLPRLFKDAK